MARRLQAQEPPPIGHNSAEIEEANRVQFLSVLAKLDAADADIAEKQAALTAARKVRKSVIGLAKMADIPEWQLKRRQEEAARSTAENAANFAQEANQRRWTGIITPEQMKMHLEGGTPQEAMDEEDAKTEGYKLGVRGRPATVPELMHARFHQAFLKGHESGRAEYIKTLAENVPKPRGMTAQEVAEQAARDFAADEPEPGTYEAQRKEREAIRRAKESLNKMPSEEEVQEASRKLAQEHPAFEASEEELSAQDGRPSNEPVV